MTSPRSARSFAIFDDVLEEGAWSEVWSLMQFGELAPVSRTQGAWKLDDGVPLGGDEIVTPPRDAPLGEAGGDPGVFPSGTALDHVVTAVLGVAEQTADLVGTSFSALTARPYVYPRGSALSWHRDDSHLFDGAFIYYAHPHWNAHWGGELLIADPCPMEDIMGHRFDDHRVSEALMAGGRGSFIAPKPNRLVLIGGAPHAVAPVRDAAGSMVRATVSGFFLTEPAP